MYCSKCGAKIPDEAKFCTNCGAGIDADVKNDAAGGWNPQAHGKPVPGYAQEAETKPVPGYSYETAPEPVPSYSYEAAPAAKKKKLLPVLAAALAAVVILVLAGGAAYTLTGLNTQKDHLALAVEESGIPEYTVRKDAALDSWDALGFFDVSAKKELLKDLKAVNADVEAFYLCADEISRYQEEKETYHLEDEYFSAYGQLLNACSQAVEKKDAARAQSLLNDAKDSLDELAAANDSYIKNMMELYESADLSDASKNEADVYNKNMKQIHALVKESQKDYPAVKKAFAKMDEIIYLYVEPENPLEITVQQVDAANFPKVKLYLSVQDAYSGEVPENLENALFYIKKEDAKAGYVKQVISSVSQLNELQSLKVDMVADVSDSMSGEPLNTAKAVMCNFINSVQFSAGDMVELTSFATGVRLEQEFSSDAGLLVNKVNRLATGDMTSLYDALYTAVERAAAQTGARCVIAFTDGNDNYSSCTMDDIVNAARRYHIPVFIIGIGDIYSPDVNYIAQQTGGAYYNVNDVFSMNSIYEEIYRMEKELYMIEFEDSTGAKLTDSSSIEAGYRSRDYGGECRYTYTPNILLSAGGSSLYIDGPEAVVEKYLRGFADAVTYSDFSAISDCLKKGSPLYKEQEKYVQRDITEQLDSFEIVSADYSDKKNCIVKTRETYYVQVAGSSLQLMTQECQYAVEKNSNGKWKMTAFAGEIKVTSRIKQ